MQFKNSLEIQAGIMLHIGITLLKFGCWHFFFKSANNLEKRKNSKSQFLQFVISKRNDGYFRYIQNWTRIKTRMICSKKFKFAVLIPNITKLGGICHILSATAFRIGAFSLSSTGFQKNIIVHPSTLN